MGRTVRAVGVVFVVVAMLSGLPSAGASNREPIKGSFEATSAPYAPYMGTDDCLAGTQPNSHSFEVDAAGLLTVKMDDFEGDWDVWANDSKEYIGGAWDVQGVGEAGVEKFSVVVPKATTLTIIACSYTGGPSAHVEFSYRFGDFSTLLDGPDALLRERLPVNFVFVGFGRDAVEDRFTKELPKRYRPVVRMQSWDSKDRAILPIEHIFDYDLTFTDTEWERRFFSWLKKTSDKRASVTAQQAAYNSSGANRVTIEQTSVIPAFRTERWLAENPPPGVNTSEYTAYFIDWYDERGFEHHLYTKMGEPDTDSGVDFGATEPQHLVAWGGTPPTDQETPAESVKRVWFYDMSAGPDWRTGNWNVSPDAAGYRILPSWEYHPEGARSPAKLGSDLGKLARYVAIDLLFTPSPLYPPSITPPKLPDSITLDINQYNDGLRGDPPLNTREVVQEVSELVPTTRFEATDTQTLPFATNDAGRCFGAYLAVMNAAMQGAWPAYMSPSCYPERTDYYAFSNLFLHNALGLDETRDPAPTDYNAMGFSYAYQGGVYPGFSGMADDNGRDGTQSFIYVVSSSLGNQPGVTDTMIHEYGHHLGVSHPHDGYDFEEAKGFGAYGDTYFAWTGDESNTVMSYLSVNNDFSQFDKDSMDRWLAGSYLEHARELGRRVARHEGRDAASIETAEARVRDAMAAFGNHRWADALVAARGAYEAVLQGARGAGIKITGSDAGWSLEEEPAARSGRAVDPSAYIDFINAERPWWDPRFAPD